MERHLAEKFPRRHNRKLYSFSIAVILILATLSFIPVPTNAASFTASLDRDSIALGESATLTLKFEGDLPQSEPSLPEIPGSVSYTHLDVYKRQGRLDGSFAPSFSL